MTSDHVDRRENDLGDRREHDLGDRREQLLASLLVAYDEALGEDARPTSSEELLLGDGDELVARFRGAKTCLELLDRVRRRGTLWEADDELTANEAAAGETAERVPVPFDPPSVPRHVGRFQIERELGRGGLGIVYLATDPKLGRQVAIKVPRFESVSSDVHRRRLLREAEAAARLSHPNLVALYEVGEDGSTCYLACEYCAGPTLSDWLRRRLQPVPVRQAAQIILKLAEAVEHAHSRGVLHRDIKPSNVLLEAPTAVEIPGSEEPADIAPKLTDFGMAKLVDESVGDTRTGTLIGTVRYMSPEQAEGRADQLDARTDVYALGAILYELLVDVAPHDGSSDVDTLRRLILSEPVPPRERRSDVPRDLQAVVLKCLAKRPADRYATAHALAGDLRRFISGKPTLARPLHAWERVWKWAVRRPAVAGLCCVSLLAASLLSAGGIYYTLRLRQHAEELSQALADRDRAVATAESHLTDASRTYPTDIRLAQEAWKTGRIHDALVLLRKHEPHPGEIDHRSFEWHYLSRLCRFDRMAPPGNEGSIYVCRYSPDGKQVATAGVDGKLRLWDASTGKLLRSWQAHGGDIDSLIFSSNGTQLVTLAEDRNAAVWNLETGELIHRFEEYGAPIYSAALMPDGQTLLTGSDNGGVAFWNTADWKLRSKGILSAKKKASSDAIRLMAVSPNGLLLATAAASDHSVRLWDLPGLKLRYALKGHTKDITAMAFTHGSDQIASVSRDYTLRRWHTDSGQPLPTYEPKMNYLHDLAFSADDRRVLVAGHTGLTQAWEVATGACEQVLPSTDGPVYSVAISPDGRQIATGAGDGTLHLWDGTADPEKRQVVSKANNREIAVSADWRQVAIGDQEGVIRVYNLATGELIRQMAPNKLRIDTVAYSPRGDQIAVGYEDSSVQVWQLPDFTPSLTLHGHGRLWTTIFSPDGTLLANTRENGTIHLCNPLTGVQRGQFSSPQDCVRSAAFSPDGRRIAAAYRSGVVRLWDVAAGETEEPLATLLGSGKELLSVAWSPDGKLLASGAAGGTVHLWDAHLLQTLPPISLDIPHVFAVRFSPDGKTLAVGGALGTLSLWNVATREPTLKLRGHVGEVAPVFFSPQGDALLTFEFGLRSQTFIWEAR